MAMDAEKVTVTTSPGALNAAEAVGSIGLLISVPAGGATVYVGGSAVDATDGFPVGAGTPLSVELEPNEILYAMVAAATQDVNVLRRGFG